MGNVAEFSLGLRLFLAGYRWRKVSPIPWAPLPKPVAESRVALVSTAGLVMPGQEPFDDRKRGGDTSLRELAGDVEVSALVETHRSEAFDHEGIRRDPNLALPLDRLREMAAEGRVGAVNHRHFSFMGSVTAPGRLVKESAPEAAAALVADAVDVALLVPV